MRQSRYRIHLSWPLTCFARGMVVVMPMAVTLVMFNRLGMSNTMAALATSFLLLPLAMRPLLAPLVGAVGQRKWWMVVSLAIFGIGMYGVSGHLDAFPTQWELWAYLMLAAIAGACFDTAAAEHGREVMERKNYGALKIMVPCKLMAVVVVMGVMMLLAGNMEVVSRKIEGSWELAFKVGAAIVFGVTLLLWAVVRVVRDKGKKVKVEEAWLRQKDDLKRWWMADRQRWLFVLFILFFPLHEFLLWKGTLFFLVDKGSIGGLTLSPQELGFAFCTMATLFAMAGYVMGVELLRKDGLKKWWWVMVLAFTIPDAVYIFLAYTMPEELWLITLCLSAEQWCCGLGMAAFVVYMIMYGSQEKSPDTHRDACWTLVITSIIISGCLTGVMQDYFGYRRFFIVVMLLAILAFAAAVWIAIRRKI